VFGYFITETGEKYFEQRINMKCVCVCVGGGGGGAQTKKIKILIKFLCGEFIKWQ
jgi:hypothetical protein